MRYLFYTILSLLLMLAGWTASPPVLTLYQVPFVEHAPVLDGKLDDACWQSVPQNTTLYKYNVMEPIPTPLKTTIQCCYDDKGLYLALRMFEKDMSKIRATITQRDDQSLWTDDCAEIYFDPNAMAIGFRKFMVNSIGTKSTLYRIDGANIDFSWSPDGWLAVPGKDANGWYMELFFPWSDLGRTPKDGDLWRFCLCRYSWSSSALATTSVGGSFTAPQYFGWLLFTRHPTADVNALAQQLGQRVPSDWLLPVQATIGPAAPMLLILCRVLQGLALGGEYARLHAMQFVEA